MYPVEILGDADDDGTMTGSRDDLAAAVVGHKIVAASRANSTRQGYSWANEQFEITLDNGKKVVMRGQSDCCAFTELDKFLLNVENVDHIITGVGTTGEYTTWHIYADMGDVLQLDVSWSCGNPFYYGYGFTIEVVDA